MLRLPRLDVLNVDLAIFSPGQQFATDLFIRRLTQPSAMVRLIFADSYRLRFARVLGILAI